MAAAGLQNRVKVIVGGVPVSQRFADQIGADAYAATTPKGVEVVKAWCAG